MVIGLVTLAGKGTQKCTSSVRGETTYSTVHITGSKHVKAHNSKLPESLIEELHTIGQLLPPFWSQDIVIVLERRIIRCEAQEPLRSDEKDILFSIGGRHSDNLGYRGSFQWIHV